MLSDWIGPSVTWTSESPDLCSATLSWLQKTPWKAVQLEPCSQIHAGSNVTEKAVQGLVLGVGCSVFPICFCCLLYPGPWPEWWGLCQGWRHLPGRTKDISEIFKDAKHKGLGGGCCRFQPSEPRSTSLGQNQLPITGASG